MNCGSPALKRNRDLNISKSEQSSASGKRSRTTGIKKKAIPRRQSLINLARHVKRVNLTTSADVVERQVKRKAREQGEGPQKEEKRSRLDLIQGADESTSTSADSERCNTSVEDVRKRGNKRKAVAGGEGPNMKKNRLGLNASGPTETEHTQQGLSVHGPTAEFEAKYQQQDLLGKGGCGSVFAGYRKADNLPVAIKHIPNDNVLCKHVDADGKKLSVEVAVMLKLAAKSEGTSAPVSLLDWYDLDQELILVLERPIPAKDLLDHIKTNGGSLDEDEAKVILKQLIDAAIDLENKHIFHRDIKLQNILIETSSDIPRVRLIDFGLSCFVKKGASYRVFFGTDIPPEWYDRGIYRAGPTTVFQMGVVLFETLHSGLFDTIRFFKNKLRISNELSENCQDFLWTSLNVNPNQRSTLKQLRSHPWL